MSAIVELVPLVCTSGADPIAFNILANSSDSPLRRNIAILVDEFSFDGVDCPRPRPDRRDSGRRFKYVGNPHAS